MIKRKIAAAAGELAKLRGGAACPTCGVDPAEPWRLVWTEYDAAGRIVPVDDAEPVAEAADLVPCARCGNAPRVVITWPETPTE